MVGFICLYMQNDEELGERMCKFASLIRASHIKMEGE